jgi:hypothetical protein
MLNSMRAQRRYRYSLGDADQIPGYSDDDFGSIVDDPSTTPGTLPRDQDNDKIAFPTRSEKLQELSPTEARLPQYYA